jgi:hypothetical protein
MLKILINSLEIDFDGNISIRLLNPMFSDEMSHSFNCKTVNTARNKDVIEQLHLPETGYNQVQFPATIISDGFTLVGVAYINSPTDKYLDFQFISQNDFWNTAKVSLRSIDIPFDARYLPVQNSKMMDNFPISGNYSGFMNAIDDSGALLSDVNTAPVPFMRFNNIVSGILDNFKIKTNQNDLVKNADLEQLYIFNSNSNGNYKYKKWIGGNVHPGDFTHCWLTLEDGKYKINASAGHSFVDGSYVMVSYGVVRPIEAQNQLVGKVFKVTVEDEHFISFDITPVVTELTAFPRYWEFQSYYIYVTKPLCDGIIEEKSKNHLPEINCGEFLHEVERLTASKIFIDESSRSCRVIFLKNILKSTDITDVSEFAGEVTDQALAKQEGYKLEFTAPGEDEYWSDRVKELTDVMTIKDPVATYAALPMTENSVNDVRLVTFNNCYYRYYEINFLNSAGWEFYSENLLKLQEGEGKFSIQTKFSPVLIENYAHFNPIMSFPRCDKEGQFIVMGEGKYEDFRLFFYRGQYSVQVYYTNHYETELWPLTTIDVYNPIGVKITTANLALKWDGEYGLFNQLYKEWIDLMVNHYREETRFVDWPKWMLNSFSWWKKYRINHMNYLVKSIDIELTPSNTLIKDTVLVPV